MLLGSDNGFGDFDVCLGERKIFMKNTLSTKDAERNLLMTFIGRLFNIEFIRFGIVGVIATMVHYGIYYVLLNIINPNVAFTIGYLLGFCLNFWLSAKFTFKAEATVKRGAGFALSHFVNYGLQMLVLNISLKLGVPEPLAPVPVYLICIPVNFLLVRFVFKKI